jgi:hypothetical protein
VLPGAWLSTSGDRSGAARENDVGAEPAQRIILLPY